MTSGDNLRLSMKDIDQLINLCERTHLEVQKQTARAIDTSLVVRNWFFGWYLEEFEIAGAERKEIYGSKLNKTLSEALKNKGIKGVSATNLKLCRQFYKSYSEIGQTASDQSLAPHKKISQTLSDQSFSSLEILQTASGASGDLARFDSKILRQLSLKFSLSWSQYVSLLTISDPDERSFYEIEAAENQWSVRELERQMDSSLYKRLAASRDKDGIKKLATEGQLVESAADLIKNPFVLEFLGLDEKAEYSENDLESAIIDKLETFLLELGKGFLFEARQKRFTFDNDHFFVDLVFYNRLLRCYVLIDLKREKLTHQDLGQMQMYVNYFDRFVKTESERPTIGMVLCSRKNDSLVELTLPEDANIFASEYKLYLPTEEEIKKKLETIENELQA